MNEFEPGQIVYVSDNNVDWRVTHYVSTDSDGTIKANINYPSAIMGTAYTNPWQHCLSVDDYHKIVEKTEA